MPDIYEELQGGLTTKWLGDEIEYSFLQYLPDYYLDGPSYASWYNDLVETSTGFSSYSNKQKQAIY